MKVVLPARWEFGLLCYIHVPAVYAIEGEYVCYIEPGREALYPGATEHLPVEERTDHLRRNSYAKDDAGFIRSLEADAQWRFPGCEIAKPDARWPRKRFIPQPTVRYDIACDVVVCPRKREYGPTKNWPAWPSLTEQLAAEGLDVFACGAADSSYDVPCSRSWDYVRTLDATLEAMHAAKLVIATDAGLAHLAVLAGRPLLLITHAEGLVAPGPVIGDNGKTIHRHYWPVHMERYREANHTGSMIDVLHHGWECPDRVLTRALELVR